MANCLKNVSKPARLRSYPRSYWDEQAREWDRIIRVPTNPHRFYYYEADLLISNALAGSHRVPELGCGSGGSTSVHSKEVGRLIAIDFSGEMVRRARAKLYGRRRQPRPDFVIADAGHLPFRDSSFDAVVSRGVLLSYVAEPRAVLAEAYRVLRRDGRIAVDAMNRIERPNPQVSRNLCLVDGTPVYVEFYVRGRLQVRRIFFLSRVSPYAAISRKGRRLNRRPPGLRKHLVSETRYEARLFRPRELIALVEAAGFSDVRVTPLGHAAYTRGLGDRRTRLSASANRKWLSRILLQLADHLRPETALHLFVTAARR